MASNGGKERETRRAEELERLIRIRAAARDLAETPTRQPIDLNYVALDKSVWEAFRAVLERNG